MGDRSKDDIYRRNCEIVERCKTLTSDIRREIANTRGILAASKRMRQEAERLVTGRPAQVPNSPPSPSMATTLDTIADLLLRTQAMADGAGLNSVKTAVELALLDVGRQIERELLLSPPRSAMH